MIFTDEEYQAKYREYKARKRREANNESHKRRYQAMKEGKEEQKVAMTCEKTDCFGNKSGKCVVLTSKPTADTCPFYKSEKVVANG